MSITVVCSVYDTVANLYGQPFHATNEHVAVRMFQASCAGSEGHPMQTHPMDFTLYALGSFDDVSGEYKLLDKPQFLTRGSVMPEVADKA